MWNIFCDLLVSGISSTAIYYFFFNNQPEVDSLNNRFHDLGVDVFGKTQDMSVNITSINRKLSTMNSNLVDLRRELNLLKEKNEKMS